ncbi:hypothetical protein, partial [Occultella gossypii]
GEQITMTIPVTNSGDTTITTLVAQSNVGEMTCEAATLAAGASTTCSVTFTPTEGENTVTVTFVDETDTSKVGSFQIVLTYQGTDGTDGTDGAPTGDLLGGLPTGDLLGGLPTGDLLGGLPTGDLLGGLPTGDLLGGGSSDGTDGTSGTPIFTLDQATVETIPAADTPEGVGEQITMTIPVTNSGDTTITTLVAQSNVGEMTCEAATLAAGASTTCSVTFTPTEGENTVTVTFVDETDTSKVGSFLFVLIYQGPDRGSNTVTFTVNQPSVEVIPAAGTPEGAGEQIRMTIPVTNSGDTTVASLVAQSESGEVTCAAATLAAGASTTCSVTVTPTEGENAVTVTFTDETDTSKVASYRFVCVYTSATS